jgi:CheY-like chemotaxis protein
MAARAMQEGDRSTMSARAFPAAVLLVEDEILISQLVADELSEYGFKVHEVSTGDEALKYVGSGAPVDVLFTDINMPGTIDGTELAKRVRAMRPDMPVVYASGRYGAENVGPLVTHSVFVPKPYRPADVCALLHRLTEPAERSRL